MKTKKPITAAVHARRRQYLKAEPKLLGNLHERMRYLKEAWSRVRALLPMVDASPEQAAALHDVHNGIWDLETEVSYHIPANPPYGQRPNTYALPSLAAKEER